jgi:hypothetical protein
MVYGADTSHLSERSSTAHALGLYSSSIIIYSANHRDGQLGETGPPPAAKMAMYELCSGKR